MVLAAITYFILFVLPFVVLPNFPLMFEPPKAVIGEILIQLLLIATLFKFPLKFFKQLNPLLIILSLILVCLSFVHIFLYQNDSALYGNPYRLQGIILLWHLLTFAVLTSHLNLDHFPESPFFAPIIGLFLATLIMGENGAGRSIGTLGEPNALATTALFFLPFALIPSSTHSFKNRLPRRLWLLAMTGISLAIIIMSGSRSAVLGLLIMGFYLLMNRFKLGLGKALIVSLVIICFSLVTPFLEEGSWFENRSEIWQTAFYSGLESPLLGQGFGNIEESLKATSIRLNSRVQHQVIDSSHNLFLDIWVQGGLLGLGVFLMLLSVSFRGLVKQKRVIEILGLLGLLVCLSFNPVSSVNLFAFSFLMGQGYRNN